MIEIWKPLTGTVDTEISNTGFVQNPKTKRDLKLQFTSQNNYRFSAKTLTGRTTRTIHVSVYEEFSGNKVSSDEWVRHIDGNPANNHISNLFCEKRYNRDPNVSCEVCGIAFYVQDKTIRKSVTNNFCCSYKCRSEFLKTEYIGNKNPNYRNVIADCDGYIMVGRPNGKMKLHKATICEELNISNMPKMSELIHIHHRDCNKENNLIENLALLRVSDHKWLHKNFGNAGLWALMNNKITIEDLSEWSRDSERAKKLLSVNAYDQCNKIKEIVSKGVDMERAILFVVDDLDSTERGIGGFVSTGK